MELMQRKVRFNANSFFKLYHLCYYFSDPVYRDRDGRLILDFKNREEQAIRHFTTLMIQQLNRQRMDKDLIIIRSLHSRELVVNSGHPSPLDRIGKSVAAVFGCSYLPELIRKKRVTVPMKALGIQDRRKELENVYKINYTEVDLNNKRVLIMDDVVTTGITVCSIIEKLLHTWPRIKINALALAWTPTLLQQAMIQKQENPAMLLHEPETAYGNKKKEVQIEDSDYENGLTNISIFS